MIQIHISPSRVKRILFVCSSGKEEDHDLVAWLAIRHLVEKIDRKLRRIIQERIGGASE